MGAGAFSRSMHRMHRAVGSVLSLLIVVWFASGAVMTFAGYPRLTEAARIASAPPFERGAAIVLPPALTAHLAGSTTVDGPPVRLAMHEGLPTWLYTDAAGTRIALRADTGAAVPQLDAARAQREAARRLDLPVREVALMTESDQWTVSLARPGSLPLYRVSFADPDATEAYLSARTGELVQVTNRSERVLAWLGAIPHWIYPTILRRERDLWRYTVLVLSAVGLMVTLSGTVAGIHVWRATRKRRAPRDPYLRLHQALGLWLGLFASTWLISGALSLSPFRWTSARTPHAHEARALGPAPEQPLVAALSDVVDRCSEALDLRELSLSPLGGTLYAVCAGSNHETRIVDLTAPAAPLARALSTSTFAALATRLAGDSYAATVQVAQAFDDYYYPTHSAPDAALPFVRVALNDAAETAYYFDPARARLLRKHTDLTRLERWLYHGLHSFDLPMLYAQRGLWRTLIVLAMAAGAALSGLGTFMTVRRWQRGRARRRRAFGAGHARAPQARG